MTESISYHCAKYSIRLLVDYRGTYNIEVRANDRKEAKWGKIALGNKTRNGTRSIKRAMRVFNETRKMLNRPEIEIKSITDARRNTRI